MPDVPRAGVSVRRAAYRFHLHLRWHNDGEGLRRRMASGSSAGSHAVGNNVPTLRKMREEWVTHRRPYVGGLNGWATGPLTSMISMFSALEVAKMLDVHWRSLRRTNRRFRLPWTPRQGPVPALLNAHAS